MPSAFALREPLGDAVCLALTCTNQTIGNAGS